MWRTDSGKLGSALASGATVVVADMTATVFCDSSWVRILALANEQATVTGIDLRLVAPSTAVQRTLTLMGLGGMLPLSLGECGPRSRGCRYRWCRS